MGLSSLTSCLCNIISQFFLISKEINMDIDITIVLIQTKLLRAHSSEVSKYFCHRQLKHQEVLCLFFFFLSHMRLEKYVVVPVHLHDNFIIYFDLD